MKKLLVALLLSVILTMTFATPAFADEGNGNMGGKNAGTDPWWPHDPGTILKNPQGWIVGLVGGYSNIGFGFYINHFYPPSGPCIGAWSQIAHIFAGQPPAKPHWAGGP